MEKQSARLKAHAEAVAQKQSRPIEYVNGHMRKDDYAAGFAERDGIDRGLVCVLRVVEPCQSFKVVSGERRPKLVNAARRCLCYYFYFIDRDFGLMHVRIQSWFPLVIQVCLNGHEWLARKLDRHGIEYRKQDNAFVWISDCQRAQKFADRFEKTNWPRVLSTLARRINPLLKDVLAGMDYYWVMDQAEYATDAMFKDTQALKAPYQEMLKYATLCFSTEDVLTFLGRKMNGNFQGEVLTDMKKKRHPGAWVKHRMKAARRRCSITIRNGSSLSINRVPVHKLSPRGHWIKMYDKVGCVLRIETVINNPREFKVRRSGVRQGEIVTGWFPMAKGMANMPRYREVCMAANGRYLEALSKVSHPGDSKEQMRRIGRRVRVNNRSYRPLNPASTDDVKLLAAVMRVEHSIQGFRNADIRVQISAAPSDATEQRRQSQRAGRLLKLLTPIS